MNKRIKRIYVDTSVALGLFDVDETRRAETEMFWNAVRSGVIVVLVSDVFRDELKDDSAERIYDFFDSLPENQIERIALTDKSDALARQYIDANVVTEKRLNDCRHVALATIHADGIVSWNMRDIIKRKKKYNTVSVAQGYTEIKIATPNRYKEIYNET